MHSSRQNPRIGKEWLSRTKGRRFSVPKVPIPPSHFTDGDYKRSLRNDLVGFQLGKKRNSTGVRSMFESRSSHRSLDGRTRFQSPSCINCKAVLEDGSNPISRVKISFQPYNSEHRPTEQGLESPVAVTEMNITSVSVLDALLCIFASSDLIQIKKSKANPELSMCFECAQALSTLYESFIELISLSDSSAYICRLIRQVKLWHNPTKKLFQSEVKSDGLEEDPFALFVKALVIESDSGDKGDCESSNDDVIESRNPTDIKSRKTITSRTGNTENFLQALQDSETRISTELDEGKGTQELKQNGTQKTEEFHPNANLKALLLSDDGAMNSSESAAELDVTDFDVEGDELVASPENPKKSANKRGPHRRVKCSADGCKKKFLFHWLMNSHVKEDHEKMVPIVCPECNFRSFDPEGFEKHCCERDTGQEEAFRCGFCNRSFSSRAALVQHSRRHDRSLIRCTFADCHRTFLRMSHLEKHERVRHGAFGDPAEVLNEVDSGEIQCSECGKVFGCKSTFKVHMEIHGTERKYLCNHCGLSFKQRRSLTRHNLIHKDVSTIRLYQCPLCHKCFKRKYNLTQHYHSKLHPQSIIEKLISGEELDEEDLKNATLRRTRVQRKKECKTERLQGAGLEGNEGMDDEQEQGEELGESWNRSSAVSLRSSHPQPMYGDRPIPQDAFGKYSTNRSAIFTIIEVHPTSSGTKPTEEGSEENFIPITIKKEEPTILIPNFQ